MKKAKKDGDDGPWSSFGILVGTPSQNVRVLPSFGESSTWVILPEGCISTDPSNCGYLRGYLFERNESTTWKELGLYTLELYEQSQLGYGGNGLYGFDTLELGWQGKGLPTLENQVIAGIATKDFYIGSFPLNPRPMNFTDFNDPQTSMLQTLRNNGLIPSLSWAYHAGAYNHRPEVWGSLVLGGYDSTRFTPNNLTIGFGPEDARDLLVTIQSVTTNATNSKLLSSSIQAYLDTTVSHIWLPISVCLAFENAFGIKYDNATDLYFVSDDTHTKLISTNPTITFTISDSLSGNESVEITFPYSSFDLTVTSPIVNSSTRYFPLRRAHNDTQYTFGRAFLQNAYVIADYDRSNFSVSQAIFPNSSVSENLVAIIAPSNIPTDSNPASLSRKLDTGALVGIIIAGVIAILVFPIGVVVMYRRRRRHSQATANNNMDPADPSSKFVGLSAKGKKSVGPGAELVGDETQRTELANEENPNMHSAELAGDDVHRSELQGTITNAHENIYEMPAEVILPELPGQRTSSMEKDYTLLGDNNH
ncbi:MAG: hypothetical protein M1834_004213 [Cirrosporium novae-zelandiae]|nr:MAG: hypothetical protein M1834_004213 [Cirrosporium novae-zelandiae]